MIMWDVSGSLDAKFIIGKLASPATDKVLKTLYFPGIDPRRFRLPLLEVVAGELKWRRYQGHLR